MPKGELHIELNVDYADDEKLAEVSRSARLLYVDACCLSKRILNDGALTASQVQKLAYPETVARTRRLAAELVDSGAWLARERGGYQIAAWLKRNKSRAQVEAEREDRTGTGSQKGTYGNHIRWHVDRGIRNPDCEHCTSPDASPQGSSGDPPTIANSDRPTIPNDRSETETETETKHVPQLRRKTHPTQRVAELAAAAHSPAAHRLVQAYAATCPNRPPADVLGALAVEVDKLLIEGIPGGHIAAGLDLWGAKPNLGVRLLPRLVHEAVNARPANTVTSANSRTIGDKAVDWLALAEQPPTPLRALPGGAS